MQSRTSRAPALLFGVDKSRTRRAVGLAAGLFVVGLVLEYATLQTEFTNGLLVAIHEAFLVGDFLVANPDLSVVLAPGNFVIIGLALIYAYLNEGYLVSVLLGWSSGYANLVWTIGSRTEVTNVYLDPVSAFTRTFPEAVVLATIGFVLGLAFRHRLQTAVFPLRDTGRKSRTQ